MWLWQRSKLFKHLIVCNKQQYFFIQLILFALIIHIFLVCMLYLFSYVTPIRHRFTLSAGSQAYALYVLSPLKKQIKQNSVMPQVQKNIHQHAKVITEKQYEALVKHKKNNNKKVEILHTEQKNQKKNVTTSVSKSKPVVEKKQSVISKSVQPEIKAKKTAPVVSSNVHKEVKTKKGPMPALSKKIVEPVIDVIEVTLDVELEHKEHIAPVTETIISNNQQEKDHEVVMIPDVELPLDSVSYIGYEDLQNLSAQKELQDMIYKHLKVPIGIKKDTCCEISLDIGSGGVLKKMHMIRSSGIPLYDASVRSVLHKMNYPKNTWNKNIIIVLGS